MTITLTKATSVQLSVTEFMAFLEQQLERDASTHLTTLMMLDLRRHDRLSAASQTPHASQVSAQVNTRIESILRPLDRYTWVSSDCLWLILPTLPSHSVAVIAASRLLKLFELTFITDDIVVHMQPCIGIASNADKIFTPPELLQAADEALKGARLSDTGYATYHAQIHADPAANDRLKFELIHALQNNALAVHYQPQVNLHTGRCDSVEALVRWIHPDGSSVPTGLFTEAAERAGLMPRLTDFVLNTTLRELVTFLHQGIDIQASVNLSACILSDNDLPEMVWQALQTWGVAPERLTLEVTESAIIHDIEHSIQLMYALQKLGVKLSIDDFGTGYSSLAYLRRFPLHELKIDRLFIANLLSSHSDVQIVRSVIDLAHNFDLNTVAEGVEDEATLELVRQLGCDVVQGFWFSRALPAGAFCTWWKDFHHGTTPPERS